MSEIILGDCLDVMKNIPDKSIDMILADLPYGTTQNKWDTIIPFNLLWGGYERVIKTNGCIALFGQDKFMAKLMLSNEKYHRYNWIWHKTKGGGFLNANRMPLVYHEEIAIFYKKLPTYNPQFELGKPYVKKAVTNGDGRNYGKFDRIGTVNINDGKRYPKSVIIFSNDNHHSLHPTQKPVELLEYLIKTYTKENELVLDNTMGSGSTIIACINTNRNYIGIEKDENIFNIAKNRIDSHLKGLDKSNNL